MDKTSAVNQHLPQHLQLNPHPGLEATLDQAAMNGWGPEDLAQEAQRRLGPNAGTGVLVRIIGQLSGYQAGSHQKPRTATTPALTHTYQEDPEASPYCEVCRLPAANRHHD